MLKNVKKLFFTLMLAIGFATPAMATCTAGNYSFDGVYTKLEYLESTGTQWIDTGFKFTGDIVVYDLVYSHQYDMQTQALFGASKNDTQWTGIPYYPGAQPNTNRLSLGADVNLVPLQETNQTIYTYSLTVNRNNQTYSILKNGSTYSGNYNGSITNEINITLFAHNDDVHGVWHKASYRNYGTKITQDNQIIRDFIPARRNSDNVLGMLDLVSGQFFTNAGTGTFVAGPDVSISDEFCVICPAGQYSAAGASSCSNVTAGYFCSGGCKTATPTSNDDCLSGNTCGKCTTDSATGRPTYTDAAGGAASCSVCPAVTGELASRVSYYAGWWGSSSDAPHNRLSGCLVYFTNSDQDVTAGTQWCGATNSTSGGYGSAWSSCSFRVTGCAAGKYKTIESTPEWVSSSNSAVCKGIDCMNGKMCTNTDAGYYSPADATTQTACPAGTYSGAGAASCSNPSAGYYASGCTSGTACTGQSQCTGTTYCAGGVQYSCPTGYTADSASGKSAISQCQTTCSAGNYMASGTYTKLEYLESTGTQYIDTGIVATNSLSVEVRFNKKFVDNSYRVLFGMSLGTNGRYWFGTANSKWYYGWKDPVITDITYDTSVHTVVLDSASKKLLFDGNVLAELENRQINYNSKVFLFALNNNTSGIVYQDSSKIYYAKMYDNNSLVRDFIPARRNSDNVLGMLDLVSGQFFTNAGSGTFIAGADVGPIGGTCTTSTSAGNYATATTVGYGSPAPQTACPAGQYSAAGASSCSNVTAGYFCSGGCKTATPTSNDDCLSGNTCGQCLIDSATGRAEYSYAGAASCSVCPAVTGDLVARVYNYVDAYYWANNIHNSINGCAANIYADDPSGTYRVKCYYNTTDGAYGGANSRCEVWNGNIEACAAGKYKTIEHSSEWDRVYAFCNGIDCMKGKVCTDTDPGYYSEADSKTQTAVTAGYFCSGGCKTATPTSNDDCLSGNTCGKCGTDSATHRPAYTDAAGGAASCSVCPAVTGELASRATGSYGYYPAVHNKGITGCFANFTENDNTATYEWLLCYYSATDGGYGGINSICQTNHPSACAAGYYDTIESQAEWQSWGGASCNTGIDCMKGKVCTATDPGKYSAEGETTQSNVTAGYFCSGGCKTATPTSSSDCLTGNTCGKCTTDSATGRPTYTDAAGGAASCSVCPAVTGELASRAKGLYAYYPADVHNMGIGRCYTYFNDDDPDATYNTACYYSLADDGYGGANSFCDVYTTDVTACAAGKYNPKHSTERVNVAKGWGVNSTKGKVCTATDTNYYSPEGDLTQTACPVGTFAPTESAVCYPHKLHVGDDVVYMKSTKQTTPSLNVQIDNNISYANMTTVRTKMNKDSDRYFHIDWGDNHYYVCDDTTCPGGE